MRLKNWRQIGERLARMDRAELRHCVRRELAKRQDRLLSLMGFDFTRNARNSAGSKGGNFFFGPESVDPILALLRQRLPGQAEQIVKQAEKICRHRFDLLGYEDLDYGSPIDWHLDAVHGRLARKRHFTKCAISISKRSATAKSSWELNRHQHLVTLAKAYRLTGDHRYADETLRQWRHWQAENPYPVGINWASSLEVAFRAFRGSGPTIAGRFSAACPIFATNGCGAWRCTGATSNAICPLIFLPTRICWGRASAFFLGVLCPELVGGRTLEVAGLGDRLAGGGTPGACGRLPFRAVHLLPRLRAGLLFALAPCWPASTISQFQRTSKKC